MTLLTVEEMHSGKRIARMQLIRLKTHRDEGRCKYVIQITMYFPKRGTV